MMAPRLTRHVAPDTVVVSRDLGGRVVRIVIPLTSAYRWPHVVTSERMLEEYGR